MVKSELPEIEVRISQSWVRFIQWCKVNVPHGQICIRTVNGEPTDLVPEYTKRKIRFDKEESIPSSIESTQF